MAREVNRSLIAYYVHGHESPGQSMESTLDYESFFSRLAEPLDDSEPFKLRGRTVTIAGVRKVGSATAFLFVSGDETASQLSLDLATSQTTSVQPRRGQLFVESRWVVVDPTRRTCILENKRPTVSMDEITRYLEHFGQSTLGLQNLEISLNRVPDATFTETIERFTRIREASVVLSRPNPSWLEDSSDLVGEVGESGASQIEIAAKASRGASLSKHEGIVRVIASSARNRISNMVNAVVFGNIPEMPGEQRVSLEKNTVRSMVRVDPTDSPLEQLQSMAGAFEEMFALTDDAPE